MRCLQYSLHQRETRGAGVLLLLLGMTVLGAAGEETVAVGADSVVAYILSCEKPEGGFGPADKAYADVSRTYFAVAALKHLGAVVPNAVKILRPRGVLRDGTLAQSARAYHKASLCFLLGKPFDMSLVQSGHKWAGETKGTSHSVPDSNGGFGGHTITYPYTKVHNTFYAIAILGQDGREIEKVRQMCAKTPDFLASRQNPDGSWNNFPAPGVKYREIAPDVRGVDYWHMSPTIGHVHLTYCAVRAYELLGVDVPNREKTIAWLQACQRAGGGFTRTPDRGVEDVWETWAAVAALKVLGAKPKDKEACLEFIRSLQNADGGFGDRPGWSSRVQSTYNAVAALDALTGNARAAIKARQVAVPPPVETPKADGMKIFCMLSKVPRELKTPVIDEVNKMGLDLIGAWALGYSGPARARSIFFRDHAKAKGYDITIFEDTSNYRIAIYYEGTGQGQHAVLGLAWPPGVEFERDYYHRVSHGAMTLDEISRRMKLFKEKGGLASWSGRLDMEAMERISFDNAIDGKGGYDFISLNGSRDSIKKKPWLDKYVGRIPCVLGVSTMNQEPHPSAYYVRTLFVAKSNSYADFADAVRNNRVVSVYHRDNSVYYGAPEWVKYVKAHADEWRPRWIPPPPGSKRFEPK